MFQLDLSFIMITMSYTLKWTGAGYWRPEVLSKLSASCIKCIYIKKEHIDTLDFQLSTDFDIRVWYTAMNNGYDKHNRLTYFCRLILCSWYFLYVGRRNLCQNRRGKYDLKKKEKKKVKNRVKWILLTKTDPGVLLLGQIECCFPLWPSLGQACPFRWILCNEIVTKTANVMLCLLWFAGIAILSRL